MTTPPQADRKPTLALLAGSVLFAGAMAAYYWQLIWVRGVPTDVQLHVGYLAQQVCREQQPMPANSGFHAVVWLLSGFSCGYDRLLQVALWYLGACWGATVYLTARVSQQLAVMEAGSPDKPGRGAAPLLLLLLAVASCLVFPLPVEWHHYYLGLLPPNVYHNSSWVSALPLAIAVFGLALRQLQAPAPSWRREVLIGGLLVVCTLFKPSFAFVFAPAYALLRLRQAPGQGWHPVLLGLSLAVLPVVLLVLGQVLWLRAHPQTTVDGAAHFALALPAGWRTLLPGLSGAQALLRFASSYALPVLAYALRPDWLRRLPHQFALLCAAVGFVIFMLVHETGVRALHGNFIWQALYANHLLYWVVMASALRWQPADARQRRRRGVLLAAIALCLGSGLYYLARMLAEHSYY